MKRTHLSSFMTGMVTMLLLVCITGSALATSGKVTKELEYRNISVTLDEKSWISGMPRAMPWNPSCLREPTICQSGRLRNLWASLYRGTVPMPPWSSPPQQKRRLLTLQEPGLSTTMILTAMAALIGKFPCLLPSAWGCSLAKSVRNERLRISVFIISKKPTGQTKDSMDIEWKRSRIR